MKFVSMISYSKNLETLVQERAMRKRVIFFVGIILVLSSPTNSQLPVTISQASLLNPYGVNDPLNICQRQECGAGQEAFYRIRESGTGWVRYWFYWDETNPGADVYDWSMPDQEIDHMMNAGLNVYATIMWAPAWATGNVPAYSHWYCLTTNDKGEPIFNTKKPECLNPPSPPNVEAFKNYVRTVVRRYGDKIRFWGFWNEPGARFMWPAGDIVSNILSPGYQAAKETDPRVTIVGPEEDDPDYLYYLLSREQAYGRLFDIISVHSYSSSYPRDALRAIDEGVRHAWERFGNGRPVWLTETNAPANGSESGFNVQAQNLQTMLRELAKRSWVQKVFVYQMKDVCCLGLLAPDDSPRPSWYALLDTVLESKNEPILFEAWARQTGDFDGDGRKDAFGYNRTTGRWYMITDPQAGVLPTYVASSWSPGWDMQLADLDGDGRSDVFLYNQSSGIWFRCITTTPGKFSYTQGNWSPGWSLYAGDFDGNRIDDFFLYNPMNGLWFECISGANGFVYFPGKWDPGWHVTLVDLNADGRSDVIVSKPGIELQCLNTGLGEFVCR